jgi:hypothetical protein
MMQWSGQINLILQVHQYLTLDGKCARLVLGGNSGGDSGYRPGNEKGNYVVAKLLKMEE